MAVILVAVVITAAVVIKTEAANTTDLGQKIDWRTKLSKENDKLKQRLQEPSNLQVEKQEAEKQLKTNEYRLEHDVPPLNEDSLWRFVLGAVSVLFVLISLFTIVVGASSVASEFSNGTIKMLLIRPYRRWKILLSKYLCTLLFAAGMMCLLFVSAFLVGGISFGFNGLAQPYLAYVNGQVVERAMLTQVIIDFGFSC
jgi:ABC-2 type transport system permease protein